MLRLQLLPIAFILFFSSISGCKKSASSNQSFTEGANIYMAGNLGTKTVYWKNGQVFDLGYGSEVSGIAVSGEDVYVSGDSISNISQAIYWKNGERIFLPGGSSSFTNGIAISGNDVYCIGSIREPDMTDSAVYWKNGVLHNLLPLSQGSAKAIAFAGTERIITGDFHGGFDTAVLWKNDSVAWQTFGGLFNAVALKASDIYIAGRHGADGVYWKNDSMTVLAPNMLISSIVISGSDVYIAGGTDDVNGIAVYWKNGVQVNLSSPAAAYASGIAIAGNDVYVTGTLIINSRSAPVYWKNGSIVKLGDNGTISAICIGF